MFHKLRSDRIKQAPIRPSSFVLLFMCFSSGHPGISNIGLVEAIQSVETKLQNGDHIPRDVAYCLVHECANLQDLQLGRQVHSLTVRAGLDSIAVLGDHLIRLFASCECLFEANYVFSKVIKPSQYTWNAIIAAYMKLGKSELALKLYHRIWHESKIVDKFTFLNILKACSNTSAIEQCRYIHGHIIEYGLQSDLMVGSILVHTYAKCGELDEAQAIFDKLLIVDVVTWGALIAGYAQHGKGLYALQCFYEMQDTGTRPNKVSFFSALKACSNMALIGQGRYIHEHIIECKLHFDTHLMNTIVDMYAKCGHMDEAIRLLEKSRNRNVVTWGAIIAGYVKHGKGILALDMFEKMQTENIIPDKVIFVNILKASGSINATEKGRLIHEQIIESRLQMDIIVGTSLLDMYSKCGKLKEAENVFDMLPNRNAVTWGTMITGYVQHGENFLALEYLEHMLQEKLRPTKVSFLSTVKACSNLGSVQQGRAIHEQMLDSGLQLDAILGSSLIDMYVKCGNLDEACGLFTKLPEHDIVTWDTMIAGYVKHGKCDLGLECFDNMQETGIIPDCVTFISVLKACGSIGAIEQGRQIHQKIIESGLQSDIVIGGMIVDMYAKCGNLAEARQVFNELKVRDLVVWNAMIDGYAQNEKELLALECFDNMHQEGIAPSVVTFLSMLKACSRIGAIDLGRNIHKKICEGGFELDINVLSTLVDMYAKCGNLKEANVVFNKLLNPDIVAWNAMIAGYVQIGDVESAFVCFEDMRYRGPKPDAIAFTSILTACGRAGLVEEGYWYCGTMKYYHRIRPDIFQVTCMVDLLGRAGCFKDVEYFIQDVEELNIHVWLSLLGTCRMHMNAELGRRCFNKIVVLDSSCEAAYVMLSNIYGSA